MISLRKKKLSNGSYSLYLDIYFEKKRHYEFLNLHLVNNRQQDRETLLLAQNILTKRQFEIQNSEHGFIPSHRKKINFIDFFYREMNERDRVKKKGYHSAYAHLHEYTNGYIQISSIDENWLEQFQKYLLNLLSINSALKYLDYVKAILNTAVREKIITTNPFTYFKTTVRKTDVEKVHLDITEIKKLSLTPCDATNIKDAFLFSCFTGLRLSDTRNLKWENLDHNTLKFRQKKTGTFEYLPLARTALSILKKYHREIKDNTSEATIFKLPSQQTISLCLKSLAKAAGIRKELTFHIARHTFATLAISNGTDLYTVSKLLGHTDIKHTQVYAKVVNAEKVKALSKFPNLRI